MSIPRIHGPFRLAVWGSLVLLCASSCVVFGGTALAGSPATSPRVVVLCAGSTVPAAYSGGLSVEGGPLAANSSVGVALSYNYSVEVDVSNRTSGGLLSGSCEVYNGTTLTGANGSFALALPLPASHCFGNECTHATGPYGPVDVGPANAPPAGYETLSTVNGSSVTLTFVAELGGITLTPTGDARVLSPNAPGEFVAHPVTAAGGPSPLSPTIRWNLTGSGWSFRGLATGGNASVAGLPGSALGALSVTATADVGPNRFSVGPTVVELEAVATGFTGGDANRTELDVGGLVEFTVEGSGAPGYTYSADVLPGLDLAPVFWPCTANASTLQEVALTCRGSVAYSTAGVADPTAVLTNTYSTAEGSLPSITVSPPPVLGLSPSAPVGYAGSPLSVRISASPGSGTPPYAQACLDPGSGTALCSTTPGPSWTFRPVYANVGVYSARAWVVDRDGTNRSLVFAVTVVHPLTLTSLVVPSWIPADVATPVSTSLLGGDLPAEYWWNVSGERAPFASGRALADGALAATWLPTVPGTVDLSLTVVDALGTLDEVEALVNIGPAVATALDAVTVPGAGPAVVGTPVAIVWQAVDLQGAAVDGFAPAGSIVLEPGGGASAPLTYVNASGGGPLSQSAPGTFEVPATAWQLGRLALTVTSTGAGAFRVQLEGGGILAQTSSLAVDFVSDLGHLHVFDPRVAQAGPRDNRTFWYVADRFGNAAPGAAVDVEYSSDGTVSVSVVPLVAGGNGTTGVWVNFTAPSAAGGTREVTDAAGTVLLGPIAFPAAASPPPPLNANELTVATAVPISAAGIGLAAWAQRRRRTLAVRDERPPEEDLRRMVEGRDHVIAILRNARALDLTAVESVWEPRPAPAELSDWVASLVADGTVGARTGPDGVARFYLVESPDGPPVVLLDPAALERATHARRALTEEPGVGAEDPARDD